MMAMYIYIYALAQIFKTMKLEHVAAPGKSHIVPHWKPRNMAVGCRGSKIINPMHESHIFFPTSPVDVAAFACSMTISKWPRQDCGFVLSSFLMLYLQPDSLDLMIITKMYWKLAEAKKSQCQKLSMNPSNMSGVIPESYFGRGKEVI